MARAPQRQTVTGRADSTPSRVAAAGRPGHARGRNRHTSLAILVNSGRFHPASWRYIACLTRPQRSVTRSTAIATSHNGVVQDIATAIRCYIHAHPDAADSIDGIHRWWLVPALRDEAPQRVEAAVAQLVRERVLRQVVQEDGRVIYSSGQKP